MSLAGDYYYVPNQHVATWEAEGWVALPALEGTGHGLYSTLMKWQGEGEGVRPTVAATPIEVARIARGNEMLAKDMQVGGSHYRHMAIQPVEFIKKNDIPYLEGNVIKYVCRHREKNGAQDIEKAIHYLQLILQYEYSQG